MSKRHPPSITWEKDILAWVGASPSTTMATNALRVAGQQQWPQSHGEGGWPWGRISLVAKVASKCGIWRAAGRIVEATFRKMQHLEWNRSGHCPSLLSALIPDCVQFVSNKIDSTHAIAKLLMLFSCMHFQKRMEAPVASRFLLEERMLLRIFSGDDTPLQNLPEEEKMLGEKGESIIWWQVRSLFVVRIEHPYFRMIGCWWNQNLTRDIVVSSCNAPYNSWGEIVTKKFELPYLFLSSTWKVWSISLAEVFGLKLSSPARSSKGESCLLTTGSNVFLETLGTFQMSIQSDLTIFPGERGHEKCMVEDHTILL